jgi:hypothetical protein
MAGGGARRIAAQPRTHGLLDAGQHRQHADADTDRRAGQQLAESQAQVLARAQAAQRRQHRAQRERQRRQ